MTRTAVRYALFVLGPMLVAVAAVRFTRVGDLYGTTLSDMVFKDSMRYGSADLFISTLALAVLGVAVAVFAAGLKRPDHGTLDRTVARGDVVNAFVVLGSAMVALAVVLFAVVPGELGNTFLYCVANGHPCYPSTSLVVSMVVLPALGAAILVIGAQIRRSGQAATRLPMTRTEVELALLVLGSPFAAAAVALFTLVPDGLDSPLLDTWVAGSDDFSGHMPTYTFLRDSASILGALGTALFAGGAGMRWHRRAMTRTDVELAFLVLGPALAALAVLRLTLVHDVTTLYTDDVEGNASFAPTFVRDSTIVLAVVGIGILVIGAVMRTDSNRERARPRRLDDAVDPIGQ